MFTIEQMFCISPQNGLWLTPYWWCVWGQAHTDREPVWGLSRCFKFSEFNGWRHCVGFEVPQVAFILPAWSLSSLRAFHTLSVWSGCSVSITVELTQASNRYEHSEHLWIRGKLSQLTVSCALRNRTYWVQSPIVAQQPVGWQPGWLTAKL